MIKKCKTGSPNVGLEPTTLRLRVSCSTPLYIQIYNYRQYIKIQHRMDFVLHIYKVFEYLSKFFEHQCVLTPTYNQTLQHNSYLIVSSWVRYGDKCLCSNLLIGQLK